MIYVLSLFRGNPISFLPLAVLRIAISPAHRAKRHLILIELPLIAGAIARPEDLPMPVA